MLLPTLLATLHLGQLATPTNWLLEVESRDSPILLRLELKDNDAKVLRQTKLEHGAVAKTGKDTITITFKNNLLIGGGEMKLIENDPLQGEHQRKISSGHEFQIVLGACRQRTRIQGPRYPLQTQRGQDRRRLPCADRRRPSGGSGLLRRDRCRHSGAGYGQDHVPSRRHGECSDLPRRIKAGGPREA